MADGQVTKGSEIVKPNVRRLPLRAVEVMYAPVSKGFRKHMSSAQVRKVRKIGDGKAIGGFAGARLHMHKLRKTGQAPRRLLRLTV